MAYNLTVPEIEVNAHKTCSLCHLQNIPCAHLGRAWVCFFCLRQALNQVVAQVSAKGE